MFAFSCKTIPLLATATESASSPFITLGWLVMLRSTRDFFIVTAVTMLISGLGTWLICSANSIHIGASGLIFGYLGFLLLRGYFEPLVPDAQLN